MRSSYLAVMNETPDGVTVAAATLPSQTQILLPLLEHLRENGPSRAGDVAEALAEKFKLPKEIREQTVAYGDRRANVWDRRVRWVRQTAVMDQLVRSKGWGVWDLAEQGQKSLTMAKPGVAVCVITTDLGRVLWAEAMEAMGYIENESVQLIFTSPPYPLQRQRDYGGWSADNYLDSLLKHFDRAKPLLTANGSLVVNLCDVYEQGAPSLLTYQEELVVAMKQRGWNLCGKDFWFNPGKPKTTPWVTKKRVRMANGMEQIWWWSPTATPFANNRAILEPYSDRHLQTIAAGGIKYGVKSGSRQSHPGTRYRADNGGKIPFNLLKCGSEGSGSEYMRFCRAAGLPYHPARMPRQLAERWVKFASAEGDMVFDPFGGSLNTADVCESLGRHYVAADKCLEYLRGGAFRLRNSAGIRTHFPEITLAPGALTAA